MKRIILHSDLNNFYASVECLLHPELKGRYVAVCGNREDRHGIVLAKNQPAKLCGVKTGEAIWEARAKCPELVIVKPHFDEYIKFSKAVREVYSDFTDLVEPFGMDECWLDVTGSRELFGSGVRIANTIRNRIKRETGLTVSVGVSYNKIFAKLGSDLKKPDAVTVINNKEEVRSLPVSDLLGAGRATVRRLEDICIRTIGDLADCDAEFLKRRFGKHGLMLWQFANGLDNSRVLPSDCRIPAKSIGHGVTTVSDLKTNDEVRRVMLELTTDISHKLRSGRVFAGGIQIDIRDSKLCNFGSMKKLDFYTQNTHLITEAAFGLFNEKYLWANPVRAVTVRVTRLVDEAQAAQISFFDRENEKEEKLEAVMENLRERFGKGTLTYASLLGDLKMPKGNGADIILPNGFSTCMQ